MAFRFGVEAGNGVDRSHNVEGDILSVLIHIDRLAIANDDVSGFVQFQLHRSSDPLQRRIRAETPLCIRIAADGQANYFAGPVFLPVAFAILVVFSISMSISDLRFASIRDKFEVICDLCEIGFLEFERPFSTIFELRELRNRIAHPKPHRDDEEPVEFIEGNDPEIFAPTFLQRLVDHEKALRAHEDVKHISDLIHDSAKALFPGAEMGPDSLEGVLSMRTTTTKLLSPEGD